MNISEVLNEADFIFFFKLKIWQKIFDLSKSPSIEQKVGAICSRRHGANMKKLLHQEKKISAEEMDLDWNNNNNKIIKKEMYSHWAIEQANLNYEMRNVNKKEAMKNGRLFGGCDCKNLTYWNIKIIIFTAQK